MIIEKSFPFTDAALNLLAVVNDCQLVDRLRVDALPAAWQKRLLAVEMQLSYLDCDETEFLVDGESDSAEYLALVARCPDAHLFLNEVFDGSLSAIVLAS